MADPGAGKSQAFRLSITDPISSLISTASSMTVDDYTREGLFKRLRTKNGSVLVAQNSIL